MTRSSMSRSDSSRPTDIIASISAVRTRASTALVGGGLTESAAISASSGSNA